MGIFCCERSVTGVSPEHATITASTAVIDALPNRFMRLARGLCLGFDILDLTGMDAGAARATATD